MKPFPIALRVARSSAWLTQSIASKHRVLRGSAKLQYFLPLTAASCESLCARFGNLGVYAESGGSGSRKPAASPKHQAYHPETLLEVKGYLGVKPRCMYLRDPIRCALIQNSSTQSSSEVPGPSAFPLSLLPFFEALAPAVLVPPQRIRRQATFRPAFGLR